MDGRQYDEIDIAKGIGILLVIIGHCFPDVSTSGGISVHAFRILHNVIYTFHMPLMFMLAGFLSQRIFRCVSIKAKFQYIVQRFNRLMIPYFVIGLLYMPMKLILNSFASQPYELKNFWQIFVGENPDGGLWFLWALFIAQAILAIGVNIKNKSWFLMFSFLMSLVIVVFKLSFFRLDDAVYYLFFVMMGLMIGDNYICFSKWIVKKFVLIVSFIMLFSLLGSLYSDIFVLGISCGVCGSILVLAISRYCSSGGGTARNILLYLGRHSMDIYVLHGIVMAAIRIALWSVLKLNYYVCTIAMLIGGLWIPVMISDLIIRKSRILTFMFLGNKRSAKGDK